MPASALRALFGRESGALARLPLACETATMLVLRLARFVWLGHVSKIESPAIDTRTF
ncbi:hypothetical protein GCM10022287_09140 [Gryllotalpicola koreensis]|uniref:Uncharacterized protein n=1 Tax=Gryllotalpicola koreensis TaxID=993086 RepID=A0ABP7ZUJ6_9MICO